MSSDVLIESNLNSVVDAVPGERSRYGTRRFLLISVVLAGFGGLALLFDTALMALVVPRNAHWIPGDVERIVRLSEIFAHGSGVFLIAVGIGCLAPAFKRLIPRIVLCAVIPGMAVNCIKVLFGRSRPVTYFDSTWNAKFPSSISETWLGWLSGGEFNWVHALQSFPSAHAATVWGLAIGMSWAFPRGRIMFFVVALLASLQRVHSLAHWPSDVVFGAALAFLIAGGLTQNWGLGYYLGWFENQGQRTPMATLEIGATRGLESNQIAA